MKRRAFNLLLASTAGAAALGPSLAGAFGLPAQKLVVGVQLSGTARWEMETIQSSLLDQAEGLEIELMDVANKQAGHVALLSGEADLILSDYIWVAALRSAGEPLLAVPHSLAVGGLMVPDGSDIAAITDLPGHVIGVAGGPEDKSWIALQAYYALETGEPLADLVEARFGAPPLVNELLANGGVDASLNFWHFNARARAGGATELVSVSQMMEAMGIDPQPPLLAWAFTEETAEEKGELLQKFFRASFAAKEMLASDDAAWEELREMMGAVDDDALFTALRDDYRRGIISSYNEDTVAAAAAAFAVMGEYGGPDLVGDSTTMDPGTFWDGFSR